MMDAHAHLTHTDFDADREATLARAWGVGVTAIAVVGEDAAENEQVFALSRRDPRILAFLGFHPDRFADRYPLPPVSDLAQVIEQLRKHATEICGIGEVGLDHWVCRTEARRKAQQEAFCALVRLALELDLPLNVHSRSTGKRTLALLHELGASRVLMHAFDGRPAHALRSVEAGWLFSIAPAVVRNPQLQRLACALPLEALALETDSPMLGTLPRVRNEPAAVTDSAQAIAELKGVPVEHVCAVTTENLRRLFRLA